MVVGRTNALEQGRYRRWPGRPATTPLAAKSNHVSSRDAPPPDAPFVGSIATLAASMCGPSIQSPGCTSLGLSGVGNSARVLRSIRRRSSTAGLDRCRIPSRSSRNFSATNGEFGDHVRGGCSKRLPCLAALHERNHARRCRHEAGKESQGYVNV